jgi:hypothetical protein
MIFFLSLLQMFYLKSNLLYRDRYQIYTGTDAGLFIYNIGQEQKIINSSGVITETCRAH